MSALTIKTIDKEGKVAGEKVVSAGVFGVESSPALISQAVGRFLANQRKAGAKAKTRSEITGSGAKIWRQKGTGRARHGNRKAPIFVGGGAAHGPTGRENFKQKLNRKMIKKALFSVLGMKLRDKKLFLLEEFPLKKTKEAFSFIQKFRGHIAEKGDFSFVVSKAENLGRYFGNLRKVSVLNVESLNPYHLLGSDVIFLTEKSLAKLGEKAGVAKKEKEKNGTNKS